jgi:hypothetical protein
MTKTYVLKTGKIRALIEEGVELELTFRRLSLPEKIRYQPLLGRAGDDLRAWGESLAPYAAHEALVEQLAEGEEAPPAPTSPVHDLDADLWAAVADAVVSVVAIARLEQDGEVYDVGGRERAELVAQLSASDLTVALAAAIRSDDLTAREKNS